MIFLLAILACESDNNLSVINDNGNGDIDGIQGRVCDPATSTWLEGATIYTHLYRENELYDTRRTTSDVDGSWNLTDLPPDQMYMVYVQFGSEILEQVEVYVPPSGGVAMDEPACSGGTGRLAVVSGNYDDLGRVLEGLGYPGYEPVDGQNSAQLAALLSDPENLSVYDAILFSGGHVEEDVFFDSDNSGHQAQVDTVLASLRTYVQQGGLIIATDWSYDVIEGGWPDRVEFYGDDLLPDQAQRGEPGTFAGQVSDSDLASKLGSDLVDVAYDLSTYPLISGVGEGTTIYLRGEQQMRMGTTVSTHKGPMTVGFSDGDGEVLFSNWRFDANAKTEAWNVAKVMLNQRLEESKESE